MGTLSWIPPCLAAVAAWAATTYYGRLFVFGHLVYYETYLIVSTNYIICLFYSWFNQNESSEIHYSMWVDSTWLAPTKNYCPLYINLMISWAYDGLLFTFCKIMIHRLLVAYILYLLADICISKKMILQGVSATVVTPKVAFCALRKAKFQSVEGLSDDMSTKIQPLQLKSIL
jgi:hypothetical protein